MKFFLDTADIAEIKELAPTGLVDGVTTNPSLVMKSGRDFREVIAEICALVPGPVSAEVTALEAGQMIAEGKSLAKIAPNVTVKLPLTLEGLKACRALVDDDIMTNVTLCFSANQALLAAKAGATFVSPFIGRLDDIGQEGMELIREIRAIYDNYDFRTEIL
ncbi:MAG TPA: transaldolase family protein, partial [Parvularculaceae bacterium]|nr:transaldolase family protein [Parvularculaceae bacterium]